MAKKKTYLAVFLMTLEKKNTVSRNFFFFQIPWSVPFYRKFLRESCVHIINDQLSAC